MQFAILGSLEARRAGTVLRLGGYRQRAVLATLLLYPNRVLTPSWLIDRIWDEPPATADGILHNYISRLRKILDVRRSHGWELIRTYEGGYALDVDPMHIDAHRFERGLAEGRREIRQGRLVQGAERLESSIALWRGPLLADFNSEPFVVAEAARLDQVRRDATQELIDAQLRLGRVSDALERLEGLIRSDPLNESTRAQHMRALVAAGRQADALSSFDDLRHRLADQLGIDPDVDVSGLHAQILRQETPSLDGSVSLAEAADDAGLIGRTTDIDNLLEHIDRHPLITVVGPPGVGKSSLVRASLRSERIRTEPSYWLDWEASSWPDRTFERQLGIVDESGEGSGHIITYLQEHPGIVVLDGVENHGADVRGFAERLLAVPRRFAVVVTSTQPLGIVDEVLIDLAPLEVPDEDSTPPSILASPSAKLFIGSGKRIRPDLWIDDDMAPDVARICRATGGLPLALEVAAARLDVLSPHELAERYEALPQEDDLVRALTLSYGRLDEPVQRLFRHLSVARGPFPLEIAEAMSADDDASDGLRTLIHSSLVVRITSPNTSPSFKMLEPIRRFAHAHLVATDEEEEAYSALAAHFVDLADRAGPEFFGPRQVGWRDRYASQLEILFDTIERAGARGDRDACAAMLLGCYYGFPEDASVRRAVTVALSDPVPGPDHLRGRALFVRSLTKFQSGDYVGASADAERAQRDAQAVGDMWAWSGARLIDASVARNFERYEASIAISDETFQAAIGNGELWMAARSLYTGAMALIHHGQPRKGLEYLEDAAELTSRLGDRWMLTEIEVREAEAWSLIGEHRRSAQLLRVTLRKAEETHSSEVALMATAALGQEELALGDADAAVRDLSSTIRPLWDAGILQLLSETMPALAAALSQIGRYEPAMVAATAQARLQDRMGLHARDIEGLNARIGEARRALGERSDRLRRRLERMPLEYLIDQLTWEGLTEAPSDRRSLVVDA